MRAGKLRHELTIEQATQTKAADGSFTNSWATFITTRVAIEHLNSREYFAAQAVQAENQVRFRMRYQPGITSKMRILYAGNYYDIQSIINVGDIDKEIILVGVEYVD